MKSDLISCGKTNMYKAMLWWRTQLREDKEKRVCYVS